jgi:hypothetical protein
MKSKYGRFETETDLRPESFVAPPWKLSVILGEGSGIPPTVLT